MPDQLTEADVRNIAGIMGDIPKTDGAAAGSAAAGSTTTPPPDSTKPLDNANQGAQGTQPPATGAPGAAATGAAAGTPPPEGAGAAATPPAIDLGKLGGGRYKSIEELDAALSRLPTLEQELTTAKAQPKFVSERAQKLFEYANKFEAEGMGTAAMKQLLHIVDLPLDKLPDHQLRYEEFRLRPENQNFSDEQLQVLFGDEEVSKFGDPTVENGQTPAQKIRAENATRIAKEQLAKLKEEYTKAGPAVKTPEQKAAEQAAYRAKVTQQLNGFDGIELKVSGLDETTQKKLESTVNFKLDPTKNQLDRVAEIVADPQGWWDDYLKRNNVLPADGAGEINLRKFGEVATILEFLPDILNRAYSQGLADKLAAEVRERRNAGTGGETGTLPVTDTTKKTPQEEMVAGALKTIGYPGM